MKRTGAEIIIESLEREGIKVIVGIPGSSNLPLYDALYKSTIRHILARHEQGAGFIAQGMARSTGRAAVCFATSGPGVTNLVTAIADAKLDSIPLVAITGQVPTSMIGTDAFQEVDTYGMTLPIIKHNFLIKDPLELLDIIPRAIHIAESGRPGPVLIDVPKDMQTAEIAFHQWPVYEKKARGHEFGKKKIEAIVHAINQAKRPVIFAGGGIINANASELLSSFAHKNSIPVALSLMGLGSFSPDDPLCLGMLGMHGALHTNHLLDEIDLMLAFGVRFDDRATGRLQEFCPQAEIIHIDIDSSEIDKLKQAHYSLVGDVKAALEAIIPFVENNSRNDWLEQVENIKQEKSARCAISRAESQAAGIIDMISSVADEDAIITTDVGQHQMWVAQHYPFKKPRTLLTSGGLGTMGFGLPTAIGASLANPGRQVICISGDGSFLMNIQELALLAELDLPVKIIIFNNQELGLVRQQQELFYNENYIASKFERAVDFATIARGFGIRGISLDAGACSFSSMRKALRQPGPLLLDIAMPQVENVFPMVPPGAANRDMLECYAKNPQDAVV